MANTYYAVFDRQATPGNEALVGTKAAKEGEVKGPVYSARWVKIAAESVADAQAAVKAIYGGTTDIPVIVTEAAWKES